MTQYYLLDGVLAHEHLNQLALDLKEVVYLYGKADAEKAKVSPLLVQSHNSELMTAIKEAEADKLAHQWIQRFESPHTLEELSAHLQRFNLFKVDYQGYYLRYADPRVMAYLNQVFTEQQWRHLLKPTQNWQYPNRNNEWTTLKYPRVYSVGLVQPPSFTMDDAQLNLLLDLSMPDTLLTNVLESDSDIRDLAPYHQLYQWAQKSHTISKNWGVYNDELLLCMLALRSKGLMFEQTKWINFIQSNPRYRNHNITRMLGKLEERARAELSYTTEFAT